MLKRDVFEQVARIEDATSLGLEVSRSLTTITVRLGYRDWDQGPLVVTIRLGGVLGLTAQRQVKISFDPDWPTVEVFGVGVATDTEETARFRSRLRVIESDYRGPIYEVDLQAHVLGPHNPDEPEQGMKIVCGDIEILSSMVVSEDELLPDTRILGAEEEGSESGLQNGTAQE
jgi:hypothetical protein